MSTIHEVQLSHQEYCDKVDRERFDRLTEHKCAERGCWHYTASGYIYCNHCLHGACQSFTPESQAEFLRLKARFK